VAAAVVLLWPAPAPRSAPAQALLTDSDGLVVFEEQPSGLLGTTAPDGNHPVILKHLGGLQGTDLPVASSDGHYLVNQEGQLVTMGPNGPVSVTSLPGAAAAQTSNQWMTVSFADGDRYVAATECDTVNPGHTGSVQAWVAHLLPTAAGKAGTLGTVTWSTGDPSSAAELLSVPVNTPGTNGVDECFGPQSPSDGAIELLAPGQRPRTIVTASTLLRVVGWPPKTPVELYATPSPNGSLLDVSVIQNTPLSPNGRTVVLAAAVLVSRTGKIVSRIPLPSIARVLQWSPDGKKIAACEASRGSQSRVAVWTVGGTTKTIALRKRHDAYCTQLLWSPDGSQLIYAAITSLRGLTASSDLQRGWTVIDLRTGQTHDVTAPGQPAAWLPSARGPASNGSAS
jgi:WD40 repeat protein